MIQPFNKGASVWPYAPFRRPSSALGEAVFHDSGQADHHPAPDNPGSRSDGPAKLATRTSSFKGCATRARRSGRDRKKKNPALVCSGLVFARISASNFAETAVTSVHTAQFFACVAM